jgi:hypothetical protein
MKKYLIPIVMILISSSGWAAVNNTQSNSVLPPAIDLGNDDPGKSGVNVKNATPGDIQMGSGSNSSSTNDNVVIPDDSEDDSPVLPPSDGAGEAGSSGTSSTSDVVQNDPTLTN